MNPLARESLNQYLTMWKVFTEDRGNADPTEIPGLAMRWTDSRFGFWNNIFLVEENLNSSQLEARLRTASDYMRKRPVGGLVNIFAEQVDEATHRSLPEIAARAGLKISLNQHGMAGDILPISEPFHPNLRFVRARDQEQLQFYADLNIN